MTSTRILTAFAAVAVLLILITPFVWPPPPAADALDPTGIEIVCETYPDDDGYFRCRLP